MSWNSLFSPNENLEFSLEEFEIKLSLEKKNIEKFSKSEENNVVEMREKPPGDENWINGGYYILEPEIFNYISKDSDIWENGPLNKLIEEKQVSAFKYTGIYQPLDTLNDKIDLEKMWNDGKPYWKVWE